MTLGRKNPQNFTEVHAPDPPRRLRLGGSFSKRVSQKKFILDRGCALAEPSGPWRPTFAPGRLENLRVFIQILCWEP